MRTRKGNGGRDRKRVRERESMWDRKGGKQRENVEVQVINKWLRDRFVEIAECVRKSVYVRWAVIAKHFTS